MEIPQKSEMFHSSCFVEVYLLVPFVFGSETGEFGDFFFMKKHIGKTFDMQR